MKKISIILSTILFLIFYGCSEDFFEKQPPGTLAGAIFENEKGISVLLDGTYGLVNGSNHKVSWGSSIQNCWFGSVASDDAYTGSENATAENDVERWENTPRNTYTVGQWNLFAGAGPSRANEVLRVINKTEGLNPAVETQFRAETRFLRALFRFEGWLTYKNIPIFDETVEDPSKVSNDNPEGYVLEAIIDDLKFAWENLPESQSQVGRPTKYAAMALAAKAYMQVLDYTSAKPLLDEIIQSGRYELAPNFHDNFKVETNNNIESIFEIQASVNDGASNSANAEMGIGMNFPHGSDIGLCCGFHQTSQNLANAFRVDENGLPLFDTFNDTDLHNDQGILSHQYFEPTDEPLDPRIDYTIGRRGIPFLDWGINRGADWIRDQGMAGPYMPALKPMFYRKDRGTLSSNTGWMTGVNANNFRYLRLGHILLWRAEVAAFEGDLELVRTYVNMIRERAGNQVLMGRVLIYELSSDVYPWGPDSENGDYETDGAVDWSQPAANYQIGLHPPFATKEEAMRAVQWEIRLEFATEGQRFFDLRRWDNLPEGMRIDMVEYLNNYAQADLRIRPFMQGAVFTEPFRYSAIPQAQIELQPGVLVQNEGHN